MNLRWTNYGTLSLAECIIIPSGPKYEQMRDGIVQAAGGLSPSGKGCLIYKAFAEYGVGSWGVRLLFRVRQPAFSAHHLEQHGVVSRTTPIALVVGAGTRRPRPCSRSAARI
jgi:hypothetical protein